MSSDRSHHRRGAREQLQVVTGILSGSVTRGSYTESHLRGVEPADLASNDQGLLKPMRDGEGSVRVIMVMSARSLQLKLKIFSNHNVSRLAFTRFLFSHRRDVVVGRVTGLHMVRRDFDFRYSVQIEN